MLQQVSTEGCGFDHNPKQIVIFDMLNQFFGDSEAGLLTLARDLVRKAVLSHFKKPSNVVNQGISPELNAVSYHVVQ